MNDENNNSKKEGIGIVCHEKNIDSMVESFAS